MRRLSYLFLAACFCLPLVGCGGEAEKAAPAAPATEEGAEEGSAAAGSEAKEEAAAGSEAKEEPAAE